VALQDVRQPIRKPNTRTWRPQIILRILFVSVMYKNNLWSDGIATVITSQFLSPSNGRSLEIVSREQRDTRNMGTVIFNELSFRMSEK